MLDKLGVEAVSLEAGFDVFGEGQVGSTVYSNVVVIIQDNQFS